MMASTLAASLLFASSLSAASAATPPTLAQKDVTNPDAVVAWLKQNAAAADKATASLAYQQGQERKRRKDWGAAAKAFGDSTAFYPTPAALNEVAEAQLRMLGGLRRRDRSYETHWRRDIAEAEAIYRSALAADAILTTMTSEKRRLTAQYSRCLAEYLQTVQRPRNCAPLRFYGMEGMEGY